MPLGGNGHFSTAPAAGVGAVCDGICPESTRLERIEYTLTRIDEAIRGNGQPGIKQRIHDLEEREKLRDKTHGKAWDLFSKSFPALVGMGLLAFSLWVRAGAPLR